MAEIHDALEQVVGSIPYRAWAATQPIDAGKVAAELQGDRRPLPGSAFARGLVRLARLDAPFDPLAFWRSRGLFMSWGLANGTFTATQLASRARRDGYRWVAVQDTAENRAHAGEIRAAMTQAGVKLATWRWSTTVAESLGCVAAFRADAHIENVEHYDWEAGLPTALRAALPRTPLATVTNFTGTGALRDGSYSRDAAAVWVRAGFGYITEAYMVNEHGPQPTLSPAILDWAAKTHLGVPETFPAVAIYRAPLAYYEEHLAGFPHHSVYLAENLPW